MRLLRDVSAEIITIKNEISRLADISKFTDEVTGEVKNHKENMDKNWLSQTRRGKVEM